MKIELTLAEAKYTILKLLGFEASYKHDVVISNHVVEITDVERPPLETGTVKSCNCAEGFCGSP